MKLEHDVQELIELDLSQRPPVECMLDRSVGSQWQKGDAFDMFSLRNGVVFVASPLHIKLGVLKRCWLLWT